MDERGILRERSIIRQVNNEFNNEMDNFEVGDIEFEDDCCDVICKALTGMFGIASLILVLGNFFCIV